MVIEMHVGCAVCFSEYNRGGVNRDADKGHRVPKILETGQDRRRHLGCYVYCRGPLRRRVWIIGRRARMHRKVTRPRDATLHV